MPIAISTGGTMMNTHAGGGGSPISPRMTKAAFFRARSPPAGNDPGAPGGGVRANLQARLDAAAAPAPRREPMRRFTEEEENTWHTRDPRDAGPSRQNSAEGTMGHSLAVHPHAGRPAERARGGEAAEELLRNGHSHDLSGIARAPSALSRSGSRPSLDSTSPTSASLYHSQSQSSHARYDASSPTSGKSMLAGLSAAMGAPDGQEDDEYTGGQRGGQRTLGEAQVMEFASGSDEMLMTLLAGQAAVDCENLPVGGWEEVEGWKKELSLLSTRLSSLVARHQREVKILTAARTLQKLNTQNKRMSKQTSESLEQSEKRVDAAEKEVLVLRDRESALRRQLMEHWSGVMSWEVRRLERIASDAQARYNREAKRMSTVMDKEAASAGQIAEMEEEIRQRSRRVTELEEEVSRRTRKVEELEVQSSKGGRRVEELEEMVVEMGRRERAMEEEMRGVEGIKAEFTQERESLKAQVKTLERERADWSITRRGFERDKEAWTTERKALAESQETLLRERDRAQAEGKGSVADKLALEKVRVALTTALGRTRGVGESEMVDAVEELGRMLVQKEKEASSLKGEMREVNMGLEEEVRRVSADRDLWKGKVDKGDILHREERGALERQVRNLSEQISDLNLRNESLSTSLSAAQSAVADAQASTSSSRSLQNRVDALTAELDSIAGQFNEVWTILPPPSRRMDANLAGPTGRSSTILASPSQKADFAALKALHMPNGEGFSGIDEMINRIRGMVDDGKVLVERLARMDQDRETYKSNAAKAKKLVEDSRKSLETYQQQVAVLEDRLAKSGATESHFLDELNTLRSALDSATIAKRTLEKQVSQQSETAARLQKANDTLSAKALELAEDSERTQRGPLLKLQEELERTKKHLATVEESADDERSRGQMQRIQLLDELNSLQAEVGDLRKQLRIAKGGK